MYSVLFRSGEETCDHKSDKENLIAEYGGMTKRWKLTERWIEIRLEASEWHMIVKFYQTDAEVVVDMLFVQNVTAETHDPFNYEYILLTSGRAKYIFLVRTSGTHDPFISGIELRRLEDGMYVDG